MTRDDVRPLLEHTADLALDYLGSGADRPVATQTTMDDLLDGLGGPLPDGPDDPVRVIDALAAAADAGLVTTNAGRYFGFVEGGVLPAALAADWLTSAWDQNPGFHALSPAAAAAEEVCRRWLCDVFGFAPATSAGFTTGAQMANLAGLAAGRHAVLAAAGWDVEADGLFGAPDVQVIVGEQRHATVGRALRFLGMGERRITVVDVDDQGRMPAAGVRGALRNGPAIVITQAGNVNTGAFDPVGDICDVAHERGAWVHVDGAFGLWAAVSPVYRHLTDGCDKADSWATDGHKWLNVPYDSGIVLCADPAAHRAAMTLTAAYLARTGSRDGSDWTPESSRRARVFPVWAALRSLGRTGLANLVEGCCAHARLFAERLGAADGVEILNDVVLNQVLVGVGDDARARAVAAAVQAGGTTWVGTTSWRGRTVLRVSVSDHATTPRHVEQAVAAILAAVSAT